jgi:putative SOS response-associated peptidase YedK
MAAKVGGFLLGVLCRERQHKNTGKRQISCSVITLPVHPKLQHIHNKAMPFIKNHQLLILG